MHISTETIQQMRDGRVRDRLWLTYAPDSVQAVNETMISLFGELLQYRDAEEAAEAEDGTLDETLRKRDKDSFNAGFRAGASGAEVFEGIHGYPPMVEVINNGFTDKELRAMESTGSMIEAMAREGGQRGNPGDPPSPIFSPEIREGLKLALKVMQQPQLLEFLHQQGKTVNLEAIEDLAARL